MKIGIDLDEVTADLITQLLDFYYKKTGKLIRKKDFHSYNWWEVWGVTREEAIKIYYDFYNSRYYDNIKPIEKAIESINYLKDKNEIFIITSRPTDHKKKTNLWIKRHLPNVPVKVIYSDDFYKEGNSSKQNICKKLGISLIIEDHKKYSMDCAESGIRTILFNKPWNQGVEHKNIVRVEDWTEAIKEVNKFRRNA